MNSVDESAEVPKVLFFGHAPEERPSALRSQVGPRRWNKLNLKAHFEKGVQERVADPALRQSLCTPKDATQEEAKVLGLFDYGSGNLNTVASQDTIPFEIVLDSGPVDHVTDSHEAPGYMVNVNEKSSESFSAANGEPIPNRGQMTLNLSTAEGHPIQSVFEVCEVAKPVWSVGKICDSGCAVTFDSKGATVKHVAIGKTPCNFEKRRGLYVASLPLKRPPASQPTSTSAFSRQGKR